MLVEGNGCLPEGGSVAGDKKTYCTPKLAAYGTLREITLAVNVAGGGDNNNKTNNKTVV